MAEDFPDDSLFRNSNVAYLEDALSEKEKCEFRVQDGILMQSSITKFTSARIIYDQGRSLEFEDSNHGCQLKKAINVSSKNTEDNNYGLPKPQTEEIKFLSFDFNDLSNVMEEYKNSQITAPKEIIEEKTPAVLQAHALSEQNPPTTSAQLKSFSCNGSGSTSFDKLEEKSCGSKNSFKDSHSSGYSSTLFTISKKGNKSGKSTQSKTFKTEKSISLEERSKSEQSKKKAYQPLQLNITKTLKHDDQYGKRKKVENTSAVSQSLIKPSASLNTTETADQADINVRDNSLDCYQSSNLEELSETSAANVTNSINDTLLTTQQRLQLESWGFPETILTQYARRGVTQMFPWQVECLCQPKVLSGGNLIYSAPTSAGKTLVAEILCIKNVLERKKKAIFILPFVSVVREKMFYFQDLLGSTGIRVEGFMGGHSPPGGFKSLDIAVCTIEKANGIVNRLLEDEGLSSLGAVVVDELHLLGDPFRGYLLELLLTKLKYMGRRKDNVQVQIIGMSATLPNLSLLSTWLDAALYSTSYRPVPLEEFVKIGPQIFDNQLKLVRTINPEIKVKGDPDCIIYLCLETVVSGHSVLIFCPTKNWCESLALSIAEEFRNIGQNRDPNAPESLGYKLREELNANAIMQTLEQLKRCPAGVDHLLARTVSFGVSFHHAGMTLDERDIIEGSFRQGSLRVIVATSTLSSGVNLPARRVIVRSPTFHGRLIDVLTYKQMVGRAGRMGKDTAGESFLICTKADQRLAEQLVKSSLRPVTSSLGQKGISSSLKRAILEVIASGVAQAPEELEMYVGCTLLSASAQNSLSKSSVSSGSSSSNNLLDPILACVEHLRDNEFVRLQQSEDGTTKYVATPLGHACLSASISPDEGLTLFKELQRARQCFVLETELHIIYQVTPFSVSEQWGDLDWLHVLSLWEKLTPEMKRVGELVGVEDRFIVRAMKGTVNLKSDKQHQRLLVHRRFYSALALHDLVNEVPITQVAAKFGCSRGMLQSLQQTASTFAGMVTAFCRRLGWASVEILVEQFQDRLQFGTHRELLDLLRLPLLNGPRARAIFNAGITAVTELTTADISVVEDALLASTPFESAKGRDGESEEQIERRRRMKSVWVCGRDGLTAREAAEQLVAEARELVQKELGVKNVNWQEAEMSITFNESELSRSRNDLSLLQKASIDHGNRNLENSSTFIDLSREGGESVDDSVFKVPVGGALRKTAKKGQESKQMTKTSPSKVERILKSIEIEPVKMHQRPETIIGNIVAGFPGPSKSNAEETFSVVKSVETDQTTSSAREGDISAGSTLKKDNLTGRTDGLSGISVKRSDVSNGILTGTKAVSTEVGKADVLAGSKMESGISVGRTDFSTGLSSRTTAVSIEAGRTDVSAGSTTDSGISAGRTGFLTGLSSRTTAVSIEDGRTDVSARSTTDLGISAGRTDFLTRLSCRTTAVSSEVGSTNISAGSTTETGISAGISSSATAVSTEVGRTDVSAESTTESGISAGRTAFSAGMSSKTVECSTEISFRGSDISPVATREADGRSAKDEEISIIVENLSCRTSLSVCETSTNSDMFEQNICDIDAALHSSMNSPAIEPGISQKKEKHEMTSNCDKTSQSKNCDLFFESLSLSESAFKDLSAMRQSGDTKKESHANEAANQGANSVISGDSGVGDPAFSLSSFSDSAFLHSNLEKKAVTEEEVVSQHLFSSQNELPVLRRSKRKNSSFDGSLHTPSPPWNLRSRKGSSSDSSRKQRRSIDDMFASPLLKDSPDNKSPSLFGESFEIDSQLRNAMDGNVPAKAESEKSSGQTLNSSKRGKRKSVGGDLESPSDSGSVKSAAGRRTLSASKKFFGSAKKHLTPTDLSTSAILGNGKSVSQSTPLRPPPSGKGNGHQEVASILTDSFLEAAFQSVFECDDATTTKKVSPPGAILKESAPTVRLLQYSPGENELDGSRKEEIPSTPHKKRKIDAEKPVRLADDKLRNNRIGQTSEEVSPVEIYKLQSSKTIRKDVQTIKEDGFEAIICPPGRPVGLSVPRAKVEKRTCKNAEQIPNEMKINEDNSKTDGTEIFFKDPPSTVKKKNSDWSKMSIIDVCDSKDTFNNFKKTILHRGTLSISFGCEHIPDSPINTAVAIGTRVAGMPKTRRKSSLKLKEPVLQYEKTRLVSLSVCAGNTDVYHVSLASDPLKGTIPVSFEDRMDLVRKLFSGDYSQTIVCFDLKEQYKMLFRCTRIAMLNIEGRDVKIADWLIEPEEKEKNLHNLALKYHPPAAKIAEMSGCKSARKAVSAALNTHLEIPAKTRACAEAVVCWHVSRAQIAKLNELQLLKSFKNIEMPVVLGFARLELNGIGFDREVALALRERLKTEMSTLQERAYELAGRTFSLSSSSETARVIYQELGLGNAQKTQGARSFASTTASGLQKNSTNKQALSRLRQDHPLPDVILSWRKLSSVMSKTFYPLLKTQANDRLYVRCILHSATGRISMHEPNLQNMPRDFDLHTDSTNFSVRSSFVPKAGYVFVAADYSQLELRLLAHLSGDITLRDILNSGRDVFRSIAMSWNKIPEDEVTDELRQRAKQVCYGMIYGIGKHALAEQLGVEDEDAEMFMISFKSAYPGVNTFLQDTVEECRTRGYVETMMGRRRYLPAINSSNSANKAHAERQAVNTTVQGSAADLTKAAMIAVDREIMKKFSPDSAILCSDSSSKGAFLVLQLHDELLYEVSQEYVDIFVDIVRRSMETAMTLSVTLPVKVRIGPSWGMLHEVPAK